MPNLKVHALNSIAPLRKKNLRLLVLGPMSIEQKKLEEKLIRMRPHFVFFIDGGLIHWRYLSPSLQKRSFSIGDGDSATKIKRPLDLLLPEEKDYSDLAFLLLALKKMNLRLSRLELLGFSSLRNEKRPDHFLINLGEIHQLCAGLRINVSMDDRFLFLTQGSNKVVHRGTFSLICFSKAKLKIYGQCKYALPEWTTLKPFSSRGLSNEAMGQFTIESTKAVLLYLAGDRVSS